MDLAVIEAAAGALTSWRDTSIAGRAHGLTALAGAICQQSVTLQRLISEETSKTLRNSSAEVLKSAAYARWLAANAEHILSPRLAGAGACIHYTPLGIVAGIMPWNFPLWQVVRFAAAALIGGNAVIVKHSPLVPRCAAAIEDLFAVAGFGRGVFTCEAGSSEIAEQLIANDRIRAVAFTGGCDTARSVAALAGRHLKKCILELGGSDAFVVMPSADVAAAAHAGVQSRIRASGQACTAAKRFIVDAAIAGEFEDIFVTEMNALRTGDALDPRSDVGPLVTEAAACALERQVRESIAGGAKLLCGGVRLGPRLYQPTALAVRTVDLPVMQEETFGPVAAILRVRHIDEAIAAANATRYGLSASVWSSDEREIAAFRSGLDVGQLFVNTAAASRVDLPFGGTKDSGYGRELGDAGVYEFVNVKTEVRERC